MNIRRQINILVAIASLALMTACYNYDSDGVDGVSVGDCYINLAITVSNGNLPTRAGEMPTGGEDGDGREAGFERENTVTGITLILYRDATGINTTADPTLELVRYFPVSERAAGTMPIEVTYTTGDQPLGKPNLNLSDTYYAIVIANAPEVAASLIEGTSKLSAVRDVILNTIYVGDPTKSANACKHFVMSSEQNNTISFASASMTTDAQGDKHFDFSSQAIVIERMAARIDFWSKNSNGYKTSTDNSAYTIPGYEYPVYKSTDTTTPTSNDRFVVTGIVPFNLTNGHAAYGNEYLIKRLMTDLTDASTTKYLIDESTTNYVIDPQTLSKTTSVTPTLTSPLSGLYTLIGGEEGTVDVENTTDNPYFHSIQSMHGSLTASSDIDGNENVVVCYPMENTLLPESRLYYHATGIAIVGYYYKNGTGTGTRYVYLGYLRHQGEAASYEIQPYTTPLATDATMGTTTAMNFGIVRNNIYRVSIGRIDEKGSIELKIKVKKWDPFWHDYIYM